MNDWLANSLHIVIFLDQHLHSLGGTQVSVELQRKFLTNLGHQVTIVTPHSRSNSGKEADPHLIELPSIPVTADGEYVMAMFGKRSERLLERALAQLDPVDIVHIQADFTMAMLGHRFAATHKIPIVQTFHHWLEQGIKNTVPIPKTFLKLISWLQAKKLKHLDITKAQTSWQYLGNFASLAAARVAPTQHFAAELLSNQVAPEFTIIPTGLDDDVYESVWQNVQQDPFKDRQTEIPEIIWLGRFSPEKRIMTMLHAIPLVKTPVMFRIIGTGQLESKVRKFIHEHGLTERVILVGKMPYADVLGRIARADLMVQTSIGFETQGMTVYESAAFGTPIVISDELIAAELPPKSYELVKNSSPEALAEAIDEALNSLIVPLGAEKLPLIQMKQSELTGEIVTIYDKVTRASLE